MRSVLFRSEKWTISQSELQSGMERDDFALVSALFRPITINIVIITIVVIISVIVIIIIIIKMLSYAFPNKQYFIPSWIPQFQAPTHRFNLQPPSYQKITAIVRRMKSSASPSPLDQISIICFKRCPYLSSLSTGIIRIIWNIGSIP